MKESASILIVEDEDAIRVGLVDVLIYHGYQVDYAKEGVSGLEKALTGKYDLILLDVMLPNMDGFKICTKIREQDKAQPIIMLTAKSSDEDVVNGFTLGADDYVSKPFSVTQLILRIKAVLRRSIPENIEQTFIQLDENRKIDLQNLSIQIGKDNIPFTKREIEVLEYLQRNNQRPVAREELLSNVWGYSEELAIETRTVDIHIARIRRKIEKDPKNPQFLITIRGAGYRLICPSEY
ncbi:MAG: response regulator transcription factor [Colwellia sp.]|nr:response regulator transcription factor [Colwellia sp.]